MTNLQQRIIVSILILPLIFLSIWNPKPYYFFLVVLLGVLLGVHEFFSIINKLGYRPMRVLGYLGVVSFLIMFYLGIPQFSIAIIVALLICMMLQSILTTKSIEDSKIVLASQAVTLFGVLYLGLLSSFLIGVKGNFSSVNGSKLLSLFFMVIMAGDTFAYFVGRMLGRHKLAPYISPGKTIEGSFGGVLGSMLFALIARVWFFNSLPISHVLILGAVMNVIGQMGDLFESLLKRSAGVKDAATLIPGHGGLLDRLDSLLFNAPILYYYAIFYKLG